MLLLAIESTAPACSAALLDTDPAPAGTLRGFRRSAAEGREAADSLIALIEGLLRACAVDYPQLGLVAVNHGPGSFTGVRSAVAAARGLALAAGLPVLAVSGLEALAGALPAQPGAVRVAALDARRGEVYAQAFDDGMRPLNRPVAVPPGAALAGLPGPFRLVGSGAPLIRSALPAELEATVEPGTLDARAVAHAAARRLAAGARPVSGPALQPLYLRAPDAHPQRPWYASAATGSNVA